MKNLIKLSALVLFIAFVLPSCGGYKHQTYTKCSSKDAKKKRNYFYSLQFQ